MASVPFALSIHHFISTVGADAGFAAIIGLAILILLWFAQARETASLREHAYEATERIQRLEARLAQVGRPAQAEPQGQPVAVAQGGQASVAAARPAAAVAARPWQPGRWPRRPRPASARPHSPPPPA